MRDWNGDGFPDPIPSDWQGYIGESSGCGCLFVIVLAVALYLLVNA